MTELSLPVAAESLALVWAILGVIGLVWGRHVRPTRASARSTWDDEPRVADAAAAAAADAARAARAVVCARHAHGRMPRALTQGPSDRPLEFLCPMCGEADVRRAGIVVHIRHERLTATLSTPIVRHETWCPDCAPLITGGWIRPAAKEVS